MMTFFCLLKKVLRCPEFYALALTFAMGLFFCSANTVGQNVKITLDDSAKDVVFPILENMERGQQFQVSFDVSVDSAPYDIRVIPDDCVKMILVNGESVSLEGINGLCDYGAGFLLESGRFKPTGNDHFEFHIRNNGGPGGLNIVVLQDQSALYAVSKYGSLVFFAFFCFFILRRIKLGWLMIVIVMGGIVLRLCFAVSLPSASKFGHDVDGHMAYVQYIVENKALPSAEDCWTCYHPPVYFAAMAPAWALSGSLNLAGSSVLMVVSFLLGIAVLILGVLILRQILAGWPLYAATAVWSFWPVMILSCARIGNDQLFYVFHFIALLGGLHYLRTGKARSIFVAALVCPLALWTKSTAAITLAVCGLCMVMGYFTSSISLKPRKYEVAAFVVLVVTVLGFALLHFLNGGSLVNNSTGLNGALRVGDGFQNLFYVDIQQLLANPFTNPWDDNLGRQYFMNYLMKTSLFGEFILLKDEAGRWAAQLVNLSFFGLVLYGVRGFWKNRVAPVNFILLFHTVAFVIASMYLRYKYPFACSNDFRYIIPMLVPFIAFVAQGMAVPQSSAKWRFLGGALSVTFVVSSIVVVLMVRATF